MLSVLAKKILLSTFKKCALRQAQCEIAENSKCFRLVSRHEVINFYASKRGILVFAIKNSVVY